jgi:hypothetical protein
MQGGDANTASSPSTGLTKVLGTFQNRQRLPAMDNAELFYQDQFWGKLGPNDPPIRVNTYPGHQWNININGETVKQIVISADDGEKQEFTI